MHVFPGGGEHMNAAGTVQQPGASTQNLPEADFSLVLGGPLYQMFRKAYLAGPALELIRRRMVVISMLAWLPLAVFATIEHHLYGAPQLPFIRDIELHVRFLVALPVLVLAEIVVHQRIRAVVAMFLERRIVRPEDTSRFYAILESATRIRNSVPLEIGLIVFTFTFGHWIWQNGVSSNTSTWYAMSGDGGLQWTVAGRWYVYASIPIFQFILLRWYLRLLIWYRLLWQVSRLNLHLLPTHPDRAGGLGFLGKSTYAFGPCLFAPGAVLAGLIASRVLYGGQTLLSFKMTIVGLVGFFVLVILGPLLIFTPQLAQAKRAGSREYGTLATMYAEKFDRKWVRGDAGDEEILGTGDIQSLADLGNSYGFVRDMRIVPFALDDVTRLAVATAAPMVPLLLTIMPLDELVTRLLKILF
jgi:hypothetical protein